VTKGLAIGPSRTAQTAYRSVPTSTAGLGWLRGIKTVADRKTIRDGNAARLLRLKDRKAAP
jgi:hypothetical protein